MFWEMNLYLGCCKVCVDDSSLLSHQNHGALAAEHVLEVISLHKGVEAVYKNRNIGCVCWDLRSISRCIDQE